MRWLWTVSLCWVTALVIVVLAIPSAMWYASAVAHSEFMDAKDERRLINWHKIWRDTKQAIERAMR